MFGWHVLVESEQRGTKEDDAKRPVLCGVWGHGAEAIPARRQVVGQDEASCILARAEISLRTVAADYPEDQKKHMEDPDRQTSAQEANNKDQHNPGVSQAE